MATRRLRRVLLVSALAAAGPVAAQDAMLGTILEEPGSAGLGFLGRIESSPYKGADDRVDIMPLYLYEGERFFLRSNAAGVRFTPREDQGLELFVERRLEGYPEDETPDILEGMETRNSEADIGARYYFKHDNHALDLTVRQDISNNSNGTEVRAGYGYTLRGDRWALQPVLTLGWRSAKLNDYYFGVESYEVTPERTLTE